MCGCTVVTVCPDLACKQKAVCSAWGTRVASCTSLPVRPCLPSMAFSARSPVINKQYALHPAGLQTTPCILTLRLVRRLIANSRRLRLVRVFIASFEFSSILKHAISKQLQIDYLSSSVYSLIVSATMCDFTIIQHAFAQYYLDVAGTPSSRDCRM